MSLQIRVACDRCDSETFTTIRPDDPVPLPFAWTRIWNNTEAALLCPKCKEEYFRLVTAFMEKKP